MLVSNNSNWLFHILGYLPRTTDCTKLNDLLLSWSDFHDDVGLILLPNDLKSFESILDFFFQMSVSCLILEQIEHAALVLVLVAEDIDATSGCAFVFFQAHLLQHRIAMIYRGCEIRRHWKSLDGSSDQYALGFARLYRDFIFLLWYIPVWCSS